MDGMEEIGADINLDLDDLNCDNINDKEDVSDEEIDAEDLEKRIWKDRVRLKRIKDREKLEAEQAARKLQNTNKQSSDQARRKKMSRAQDGILKYMLKLMEVCKARGFVYGIIPEKGKPVTGSSDNIRAWWKEKVKFDKNGPAAIAKYEAEILAIHNGDSNENNYSQASLTDLQDPSSENGTTSGITEIPLGAHGEMMALAIGGDSDYDVDDGVGCVSSKDDRENATVEAVPTAQIVPEKERVRKRQHGRKRKREISIHIDQLGLTNTSPEKTQCDSQIIEKQTHSTQLDDIMLTDFRHSIESESQISACEFNQLSAGPTSIILPTQSSYVNQMPMLYPSVNNSESQNGLNLTYYDPSTQFQSDHNGQHYQLEVGLDPTVLNGSAIEPQVGPKDDVVHALPQLNSSGNEIIGGDLHFVPESYLGEQERPVDMNFPSPINNLSMDFDFLNSPFNFVDSTDPLGDFLLDDDELISYFAS
ncbi:hypothetical protein ACFE04_005140 [Oxalis oulophora]